MEGPLPVAEPHPGLRWSTWETRILPAVDSTDQPATGRLASRFCLPAFARNPGAPCSAGPGTRQRLEETVRKRRIKLTLPSACTGSSPPRNSPERTGRCHGHQY